MSLPFSAKDRKTYPVTSGVLDYFPDAIAEVAHVSYSGNNQHNPGEKLHWAREKSTDHADCIGRHLIQRGTFDSDGERHSAKLAWRALALLQEEIENDRKREACNAAAQAAINSRLDENSIQSKVIPLTSTDFYCGDPTCVLCAAERGRRAYNASKR